MVSSHSRQITLYEIDGVTEIARDNAAVMIYNAMCVATTVKPADNYTVGYYVSNGTPYIKSVYKDYNVVDAQIIAIGNLVYKTPKFVSADGKVTHSATVADGTVIFEYTDADGNTAYYAQAYDWAKKAAFVKDGDYTMLGQKVTATYYDGAVKFFSDDAAYDVVAIATQYGTASANNSKAAVSLKDGDKTYSFSSDALTFTGSDYKYGGAVSSFTYVADINDTTNANLVYALVKGTAIQAIIGIEKFDTAVVNTYADGKVTFSSVNSGASVNTSDTYVNLTASDDMKLANGDYVLVSKLPDDLAASGTTHYVDIAAKLDKNTNVYVNGYTASGAFTTADGKTLAKASSSISYIALDKGVGYNWNTWTYDGLVYAASNMNIGGTGATGSYVFVVDSNVWYQGNIPTAGYQYKANVVFDNNVAASIVVSSVNGVATNTYLATTYTGRYALNDENIYTYTKNADGTYALYTLLDASGVKKSDATLFNGEKYSVDAKTTYRVRNNPVVFAMEYNRDIYDRVGHWVAIPYNNVTFDEYGADGVVFTNASLNDYTMPSVIVMNKQVSFREDEENMMWRFSKFNADYKLITDDMYRFEKIIYGTIATNGLVDFMNSYKISGVLGTVNGAGAADSSIVYNSSVNNFANDIPADTAAGAYYVQYANSSETSVRFILPLYATTFEDVADDLVINSNAKFATVNAAAPYANRYTAVTASDYGYYVYGIDETPFAIKLDVKPTVNTFFGYYDAENDVLYRGLTYNEFSVQTTMKKIPNVHMDSESGFYFVTANTYGNGETMYSFGQKYAAPATKFAIDPTKSAQDITTELKSSANGAFYFIINSDIGSVDDITPYLSSYFGTNAVTSGTWQIRTAKFGENSQTIYEFVTTNGIEFCLVPVQK